jgi:hypothetical protein
MERCIWIVLGAALVGLVAYDASDGVVFGGVRSIPELARRAAVWAVRAIDRAM